MGKGQKERTIVLKPDMWAELMALRAVTPGPDVFVSLFATDARQYSPRTGLPYNART